MGEKLGVGEVPCPRTEVGHHVGGAWYVVGERDVAVVTLVQGLDAKEVCGGTRGRGGSFTLPIHGGSVVVQVVDCFFADVHKVSSDVVLGDGPHQFQVAVGDVPVEVLEGDEARLD